MREKYLEELLISTIIGAVAAYLACILLPGMRLADVMSVVVFLVFWILGITLTWHVISLGQWIRRKKNGR